MTQTESEHIPYQLGRHPWDARYTPYIPWDIPGMKTVPATHPRLASIFYRIGSWFTEKAEDWDEHTYFVRPTPLGTYSDTITFGDYTYDEQYLKDATDDE